ncbi:MAG: prepilin-type N-terminal cleavage/methylation domain-containing protein [bacterium]|nr:prepilin-type N-terminal cleavage/methylation domain-containing protein [bacterium]MCP5066755.1 prepilin-type N-terminal cleavage/methylation domain-containing protein [bacterium]
MWWGRPALSDSRNTGRLRAGVTLVELVVSITIIAVALVGTFQVVRVTVGSSADPMIRQQATAVADAYLAEILLKPFYDPDLGAGGGACPTAEATRSIWDNVCDYHGLDDNGARDQQDAAISGLSGYRVRVLIDTTANLGGISGATNVIRVDVRVNFGTHTDFLVSGYRTRS